jgi:4-nitrophenyl phosphatase
MPKKEDLIQLGNVRCFLLDMDGTFYLGDQLLPGAKEFLRYCETNAINYLFLTNNSSKNAFDYVAKLHNLGVDVAREKILTSGEATCRYLKKEYPGKKIFLAGTPALEEEFRQQGFPLTQENPDLVVLGFDTTITYAKLWKLCDYVRAGLPYIATHPDINCPTEQGYMPDIGAMIAFIAAATGRNPDIVVGKPNSPMLDAILEKVSVPLEQIAMIGDRLYTDVAMGKNGIMTVLVLSGETSAVEAHKSEFQADLIVNDLADLLQKIKQK